VGTSECYPHRLARSAFADAEDTLLSTSEFEGQGDARQEVKGELFAWDGSQAFRWGFPHVFPSP
jgi:hypothetical protein